MVFLVAGNKDARALTYQKVVASNFSEIDIRNGVKNVRKGRSMVGNFQPSEDVMRLGDLQVCLPSSDSSRRRIQF